MGKSGVVLATLLISLFLTGCVERKLIIRSEPPGATVYLNYDSALVEATPVEHEFTDYGTYAVRLQKAEYEELEAMAEVKAPWYSYPPFDIITELLVPWTIEDHHEFTYALTSLAEANAPDTLRRRHEELIQRAEEFRTGTKEELSGEEP